MHTVIDEAPAELAGDIALIDGVLYCSDSRKGDPLFLSFSGLARRRGVTETQFIPASQFAKLYGENTCRQGSENNSEIQRYAIALLQTAYSKNATDIHLADYGAYGTIQFRCMGMLRDYARQPGDRIQSLIAVIYGTLCQQTTTTTFTRSVRQDARIARREFLPQQVHSVRVHTEPLECSQAEGGTGTFMTLRLLYDRTEAKGSLETRAAILGYGPQDAANFRFLTERTGLTIISGPTGHGKSTLLKHIMEAQSEESPENSYMSIEDPPEYPLSNVKQIMVSTNDADPDPAKRGRAYTNAIAGAMRSDPDVIMIGEIRYPEAAVAAIDAALTGHGVWATLHANNALGIIMRMVSLLNSAKYAEPLEYLCDHNVLAGLVYQRLVPLLCPHCKLPIGDLTTEADRRYESEVLPIHTSERLLRVVDDLSTVCIRGRGCKKCDQLGITGQTVAAEVIVTDEVLLRHVRQGNYDKAYTYWLKEQKGRTYIQHAIEGISSGLLDPHLTELRMGVPLTFTRSTGEGA